MAGNEVDNDGEVVQNPVPAKDALASLRDLTPEQIQRAASAVRAALEVDALETLRQERRRQIRESLLMQAYTIKAFRVSLANPKKNITFEKMMAYTIEQINIASRLYPEYFNFLSPGTGVSTVHDLENSLQRIISYCTETVTLPNGIQQVQLKFSFQVYTECAEMKHRLEVAHHAAKSIFRPKDETMYLALSKYAVQLESLVTSMQFQARTLPREADLLARSAPLDNTATSSTQGSPKVQLQLGQFTRQLFPQLARQEPKAAPQLKGMAARKLTPELQLEQTATLEQRAEAEKLLESIRGDRLTGLDRSQVFRHLGQIKTQADGIRRAASAELGKAAPSALPTTGAIPEQTGPATAPAQRAPAKASFFFTAQDQSGHTVLLKRSKTIQGSSVPSSLARLDALFADEAQGQEQAGKLNL